MNLNRRLLLTAFYVLSLSPMTARAADSVQGQVADENGKLLEGVAWKISGIEELRDGKWTLVIRTGWSIDRFTDAEGRFVVTFHEPVRYDLQFHKPGYAPAFLFEVAADSPELRVTLRRGESIHGTVTRLVDGNRQPVAMASVALRLPNGRGVWYEERISTDSSGRFEFRACAPPTVPPRPPGNFLGGRVAQDSGPRRNPPQPKWQVAVLPGPTNSTPVLTWNGTRDDLQRLKDSWNGEHVEIDVRDGEPVQTVDLELK